MTLTTFGPVEGSRAAAVRHRDTAWLSAVGGSGADAGAQARAAWSAVLDLLGEGGFSAADVVRVVDHVTTRAAASLDDVAEARTAALGDGAPAVSRVVVPGFPGDDDALVQLEVVASTARTDTGLPGVAEADGVVWLSSLTAPGADVVEQSAAVFDALTRTLSDVGLHAGDVVLTIDHTTFATLREYKRTGRPRRATLGPVWPGSAGILQEQLAVDGSLLSLDAVATRHQTTGVDPGWERYAKLTYLPAVEAGPLLWMSGQGALDPETETALFPGDVVAQAEYTYNNIATVLTAAGRSTDDVVQLVEHVTPAGLARYPEVAAVRERFLQGRAVAMTSVVCAGLLRPEFEIEVVPLAVRG